MKDKQRHQLLDAVRELVGHPDMNRGDADLAWLREVGEGLYNASEHIIHSQLEGGRLAGIQRRLGVLPASKGMTPAEFLDLAQELLARPSCWTEDETWVLRTLRDVARVRPGKFVPKVVADHMRLICQPCPPAPGQRDPATNLSAQCDPGPTSLTPSAQAAAAADLERVYWDFDDLRRRTGSERGSFKSVVRRLLARGDLPPSPRVVKPDPSAKLLEAWLGIVREDREWLGIEPGSTSFGPVRRPLDGRKWRTRTLRAEYEVPPPKFRTISRVELAEGMEVFVPDGDSLRKVSAACLRHAGPAKWGYLEELADGPEGRSVFREFADKVYVKVKVKENISPPPGYREIDLAEMSVGDYVLVRVNGNPREVVVTKRSDETGEMRLGHVHYIAGGWKFSEFTHETYVKVRSEK